MRARVLPMDEWGKLPIYTASVVEGQDGSDAEVNVIEDDGEIVGAAVLVRRYHLDGVWIRSDHRCHAGVARALLRIALEAGSKCSQVLAASDHPTIVRLLRRIGAQPLSVPKEMAAFLLTKERN